MTGWLGWSVIVVSLAVASPVQAQVQYPLSGPITAAERSATETARDLPATEYRDAYCARWTDGCTTCQRTSANDQPACRGLSFNLYGSCQRQAVECRAALPSIGRVCLAYNDGCNRCVGGACTLVACPRKEMNYQCRAPRRARYDQPGTIQTDLQGIWRLTTPGGQTCEIVVGFGVQLTHGCVALGSPVTDIRSSRMAGATFQLTVFKGDPLIEFDTSDLDDLTGSGASAGYRMMRLETGAWDPRSWEGAWRIRNGAYACDLFLTMRLIRIGPHPGMDVVRAPHQISLATNCLDPTDESRLRIGYTDNRPPQLLPRWTGWDSEGLNLVLRDDDGRRIVFTPAGNGSWQSPLQWEGRSPTVMEIRRVTRYAVDPLSGQSR